MPSPRRTRTIPLSLSRHQHTQILSLPYPSSRRIIHNLAHNLARRTRPTTPQHHNTPYTNPNSDPTSLPRRHTHPFSTTLRTRTAQEQNYYQILDIPITATIPEIKKKFYALSLLHHPDRNRTDPTASARFAQISTAYSVLSDASKRATYDRDHGIHHRSHPHTPAGSHSSHSANLHKGAAGYAGSRPASGLSKRRGSFRGPPPSFYKQGGYGDTGRTGEGPANTYNAAGGGGFSGPGSPGGSSAGVDPEDPLGFIDRNPLGHFNARGHFRTQRAEDERRRERASRARRAAREKADLIVEGGASFGILRFLVVCGILVVAGGMTGLLSWGKNEDGGKGKKKKKKKDGSSS